MRLVIQRVNYASVTITDTKKVVGKIDKGFFILVGVGEDDSNKEAENLALKVSKLRIMKDGKDKMNLSVRDVEGKVLAVSQFTLFADTSKGNRPSFIKAAKPEKANEVYEHFVEKLREFGVEVETGEFGAYMKIDVELDGPVTIIM